MNTTARTRWVISYQKDADQWHATSAASTVPLPFKTQGAAITAMAKWCRARLRCGELSELIIKGENGKIRDSRTYGKDPPGTKG